MYGSRAQHQLRLALTDFDALDRTSNYLLGFGVDTYRHLFARATERRRALHSIRTHSHRNTTRITELIEYPDNPAPDWKLGFLAGIFDAEGSYARGILRICNTDLVIVDTIGDALGDLKFDFVIEPTKRVNGLLVIRIRGGLAEHLRFFHTVQPAIPRKRHIGGQAVKNSVRRRPTAIERLGSVYPMPCPDRHGRLHRQWHHHAVPQAAECELSAMQFALARRGYCAQPQ
jgi:hypothetical protein